MIELNLIPKDYVPINRHTLDSRLYREWYPEKYRARVQAQSRPFSDEDKARLRDWAKRNVRACSARTLRWQRKNRDHVNALRRARRAADAEAARAKCREYYHQNNKIWVSNLVTSARARSRQKGWDFDIDTEFLESLMLRQGGKCHWTGVPLDVERHSPWKMSIDRLDNSKGYTRENVVISSWFANRARGTMSVDEFVRAIARIRETGTTDA